MPEEGLLGGPTAFVVILLIVAAVLAVFAVVRWLWRSGNWLYLLTMLAIVPIYTIIFLVFNLFFGYATGITMACIISFAFFMLVRAFWKSSTPKDGPQRSP